MGRGRVANLAASRSPCNRVHCAWVALACSAAAPSCSWACASSSAVREHTPSCRHRYDQSCSTLMQRFTESFTGSQLYALSSGYARGT